MQKSSISPLKTGVVGMLTEVHHSASFFIRGCNFQIGKKEDFLSSELANMFFKL
jgi:hypothetical protein